MESTNLQHCSAVVVLRELVSDSLILIKRSEQMSRHPGEIGFPGGFWEEGDASLYDTALRELHEELGISADRVSLIHALEKEETLRGITIYPWLANIESIEPYQLNQQEVDRVIRVPMQKVLNPDNYRKQNIVRYGLRIKSWHFIDNAEVIWGATARIMLQLASGNRSHTS